MKKKIILISASAVIAVTVAIIATVFGLKAMFFSPDATLTVENAAGSVGDTVEIPIKISQKDGFMGIFAEFEFDNKILKYKGYKAGNVISDYNFADNEGVVKFIGVNDSDTDKSGTLFTLEFEILSKSEKPAEISIYPESLQICNYNEEELKTKIKNGTVTIE